MVDIHNRSLLDYHLQRLQDIENIWLVVGYQEEEVIQHAIGLRPDIVIVRNPDYARTNTLQSIYCVSQHLKEPFLAIDADTVVEDSSFQSFLKAANEHQQLIAISDFTTTEGVRVKLDGQGRVTEFNRLDHDPHEWAGIAILTPDMVINQPMYVYQALEPFLPLPAFNLNAFDIDTVTDLDMARHVLSNNWKTES
jgi:choline kinase